MCSGVVISLVKFKNKNKNVRIILSGIGSHSALLHNNNIDNLQQAGWKESINEEIISIESDFSWWNRFSVDGPKIITGTDLKILKNTYKACAGDAEHLIAHVKRCGKVDIALIDLLDDISKAQFHEETQQMRMKYNEIEKPAWEKYKHTTDSRDQALMAYYGKKTAALETYYKAVQPVWIRLFSVETNRIPHLQKRFSYD